MRKKNVNEDRNGARQLTLLGSIVKKDNELIRSKLNISTMEGSRILASLIAQIRTDDNIFDKEYSINAKDCLPDMSGRAYIQLKAICKILSNATAEVEIVRGKGKDPTFEIYPFFSFIKYDSGVIRASFNSKISQFLFSLSKCFTEYNLGEYLLLTSFYSQRLFEILKSWSGLSKVVLPLKDLHRMLDVPMSFKQNFKNFRVHVLEIAYKDIHEKTSLTFEWQPIKSGRSVEAIKFSFSDARKKITEKELKKANEDKQTRLQNQRMIKAVSCSTGKKGECAIQDNKPIICKLCNQFDLCEEVRRNNRKMLSLF